MSAKERRTSIIPVFIPHIGCPWRCVFCNQWRITGRHGVPGTAEVERLIRTYTAGREERHWEAAFYGGSFTAIPAALQEELLAPAWQALQAGKIEAVRCSTRPDCITPEILARLQRYGLTIVELGVQSMDDTVLRSAKRGHTAADVVRSVQLLRSGGFTVGLQLMPGLPGEDWQSLVQTTEAICALKADLARIYPVVVIKDTELAERWQKGEYKALTVHEGVQRAAYMKQRFLEAGINVIRTGLQSTENLDDPSQVLAGAYAPAMGEMVDTKRYQQLLFAALDALLPEADPAAAVQIYYNRRDTSRVRGIRNVTVKRASMRYRGRTLLWREDQALPLHTVGIGMQERTYFLNTDQNQLLPARTGHGSAAGKGTAT